MLHVLASAAAIATTAQALIFRLVWYNVAIASDTAEFAGQPSYHVQLDTLQKDMLSAVGYYPGFLALIVVSWITVSLFIADLPKPLQVTGALAAFCFQITTGALGSVQCSSADEIGDECPNLVIPFNDLYASCRQQDDLQRVIVLMGCPFFIFHFVLASLLWITLLFFIWNVFPSKNSGYSQMSQVYPNLNKLMY
jgi:hypothetical protein